VLEQLQLLRDLQELDQQKLDIDQQRQQELKEQEQLQTEVDRLQEMVDALASEIEELEGAKSELNQSLTQEHDNIQRSESRLPQIKTQKEYVAVLKEVDTAKKLAKELEAQIETKNEELTTLEADKAEKDEALNEVKTKADSRRAEIDAKLAEFDSQLAEMGKQRESLSKHLPTALRKRYDLLLSRRGGLAVVEARAGACLGCNMHLPPQLFNSLFVAKEVQTCPHCNRLLYVTEQV
jgi:predicted  nucleic acid-binding Zn-ribbon protein